VRVQNALAIATSDRSVQIQAKRAADANRIVQDLFDAASVTRSDDFTSETNADPESSAIVQTWSAREKQQETPASQTGRQQTAAPTQPRPGISLWA
jgi:hypothetical protein